MLLLLLLLLLLSARYFIKCSESLINHKLIYTNNNAKIENT